jgi:hypothetical protein
MLERRGIISGMKPKPQRPHRRDASPRAPPPIRSIRGAASWVDHKNSRRSSGAEVVLPSSGRRSAAR